MQESYLKHVVDAMPTVAEGKGASGYFSAPSRGLDPNLFDGQQHLHPEVRAWILGTLYEFWAPFDGVREWATVYIAGSGAAYQWAAARDPGDLDILIGVDWPRFYSDNDDWDEDSTDTVTYLMDESLKRELWPRTAATRIGDRAYEVTFYVNVIGSHLDAMKVYAAYDVTHDRWAHRPPKLPEDPRTLWSDQDWAAVAADRFQAAQLRIAFDAALSAAKHARPGTPAWSNALPELRRTAYAATALYNEIHGQRGEAFTDAGQGYFDARNFRWQAAKLYGVIDELLHIKRFHDQIDGSALLHDRPTDVLVHRALRQARP